MFKVNDKKVVDRFMILFVFPKPIVTSAALQRAPCLVFAEHVLRTRGRFVSQARWRLILRSPLTRCRFPSGRLVSEGMRLMGTLARGKQGLSEASRFLVMAARGQVSFAPRPESGRR